MGSQSDQTYYFDGTEQEGFYQRLWLRKIRFVWFLAVLLGLIVVIALAFTWPGDTMTTKEPMYSPAVSATDEDHYYKIKEYLCVDIEQESSGCSVCPAGWLGHRESCYYFSSGREYRTWNESRETCKRMGADLTIIEDREEQEFIQIFSKEPADVFWIGAHRDGDGWRWVDGQRYDTGLSQLSGESSADCACLYSGVVFYKDNCKSKLSWICEKKAVKI